MQTAELRKMQEDVLQNDRDTQKQVVSIYYVTETYLMRSHLHGCYKLKEEGLE